jgi:Tfp pilus assembly PilM family ATPase
MGFLAKLLTAQRRNDAKSGVIGLDCSLESMHLVQFDQTHDLAVNLRAKTSLPYPQPLDHLIAAPGAFRQTLKKQLKVDGFRGQRVVSTLPAEQTSILSLTYRLASGQNEDRVIAELMRERLNGDLAEWVLDYLPIRQNTAEERLALVAYAQRKDAIAYLEMLRKCGLEVQSLDIRPVAIKRLVYLVSGATLWNALSINCGRERSFLTLFSARRVLYDQAIEFGETRLLSRLAEALELPVELLRQMVYNQDISSGSGDLVSLAIDANLNVTDLFQEILRPAFLPLIEAVDRALIFAASETRGEPVREIYLLGSIARWAGIEKLLQSMLRLPVRTIPDPTLSMREGGSASAEGTKGMPELAVATGLALKGMLPNV